jgi:hypothetical protein
MTVGMKSFPACANKNDIRRLDRGRHDVIVNEQNPVTIVYKQKFLGGNMENQVEIPSKVKAFGIIHMVYAGLGILMSIWGFIQVFTGGMGGGSPEAQAMQETMTRYMNIPAVKIFNIGNNLVSIALYALLIFAGIKLLKFLVAGRALSLAYAWISIVWSIIGGATSYFITNKYLQEVLMTSDLPESMIQGIEIPLKIAPAFALCCLIYPIVILIVMMPEKYARLFPDYVPEEEEAEE